jgi:NDP-sugar pyrophosphorylase family protein
LNVIVLLAGSGVGFMEAGLSFPKPLVEIAGRPLVQHVIENLSKLAAISTRFTVLIRQDDNYRFHIGSVIRLLAPQSEVIEIRHDTSGAACTALLAVDLIDSDEPLVIVNGDQIIEANLDEIVKDFELRRLDGGIVVFPDVHPRWSFVKVGTDDLVVETAEKRPISNLATAGFYWFRSGADFVSGAKQMILKNAAVNNLFYVCPVYNELILLNRSIGVSRIAKSDYISLSTPQSVEAYDRRFAEADGRTTR